MPIHLLDLPVEIIDLIVEKACAGQRYEGHLTSNMPAGLLLVTCRALYPIARQKLWQVRPSPTCLRSALSSVNAARPAFLPELPPRSDVNG